MTRIVRPRSSRPPIGAGRGLRGRGLTKIAGALLASAIAAGAPGPLYAQAPPPDEPPPATTDDDETPAGDEAPEGEPTGTGGAPATPARPSAAPPAGEPLVALPPTEAELAHGKRIAEVRIVGNRRVSQEEIEGMLRWLRPGRPFNSRGMSADVRELWDSGFFDDIEVDLTTRNGEVALRLLVRERPSIREVRFEGNAEIDDDDLGEIATAELKAGDIINYANIRRAVQRMRDRYAEEGHFLAEIDFEVAPQRDNQVDVVFTVREFEQVTVRRITFIGNDNVPDDELLGQMATGQKSIFSFGSGGPFRQDMFERDVLVLQSYYYDKGYLSVQVAAPRVMLTPDRTGIDIVIPIDEGPRYKVRRLDVFEVDADGKRIEPLIGRDRLREQVRAMPGEYFNRAELIKDITTIQRLYRDEGYAYVDAAPTPQLYPDEQLVDIAVRIQRGQQVKFGRIQIRGNTKTRDKVIRREMEIDEGKLFSETGLERSRERITRLGYFDRVDMSTEAAQDPGYINVNVEVVERPTGTFQIGAGFSSIESFIATAQVQQANLFGRGQSLALVAQLSGLRQLIDIRFIEPYLFDTRLSAQVSLFDQLRVYNEFALDSIGGSLTLGYPIIDPELNVALTYTLKDDQIDTRTTSTFFGTASAVSLFQRLPLANLFADGITSSLRPSLTYDTRNNRLFPTKGVYLQGSTELALSAFGSDNEYIRHRLIGRFYYPITSRLVLKVNAEAGLVTSPSEDGVPLFARTFLGGIFDLRGFRLRTVGPRLPLQESLDPNAPFFTNGAVIGGNLSYFQNIELEMPLLEAVNLSGVIFTDLGNAWNLEDKYCLAAPASQFEVTDPCFDPGDIFNVRTSWGLGLRWFSPLGPLRFEWGFPFSPLPFEETSVFEFTIGNFF